VSFLSRYKKGIGVLMNDERTLYIGIDLCDDFTQISCFTDKDDEPESVCVSFDKTKYMIPTCLCMRKETGEWLIGEEAVRCLNRNGGYPIDNLLELFENNGEVIIQDTVYGAGQLMERFLKNVLGIIRQRFSNNGILYMVITAQKLSETTKEALYEALVNDKIAAAGLDVLVNEPMSKDNPLSKIKDSTKLFITPHMGWGSFEARQRCAKEVYKNIESFLEGKDRNRVI